MLSVNACFSQVPIEKVVVQDCAVYVDKIVEKEVRRRPAAQVRATRRLSGRECADQSSCPLSLRELAHASTHAFACARSELNAKGLLDQHSPTNNFLQVPKIVEVERIIEKFVEVPVDRIVEVPKIVEVERVVEKEIVKEVVREVIVEKRVEVPKVFSPFGDR
jgi:hypothetical protein